MTHGGFKTGDYVIVRPLSPNDGPEFDDFRGYTFKITELTHNLFGRELIRVRDIARPDSRGNSFYPSELLYESGDRPSDRA